MTITYMSVPEVAQYCSTTPCTVHSRIHRGLLPATKRKHDDRMRTVIRQDVLLKLYPRVEQVTIQAPEPVVLSLREMVASWTNGTTPADAALDVTLSPYLLEAVIQHMDESPVWKYSDIRKVCQAHAGLTR